MPSDQDPLGHPEVDLVTFMCAALAEANAANQAAELPIGVQIP